jgi:CRISPR/Cas system Type II protein with McrA/HNH and RuvC-like nuclease domain
MLQNETFSNISKIIERDSKSSTYKFALLRGVIDIIQDNSPYINIKNNEVEIPLGLLIEKWLLFYYPLLESNIKIPQINGVNTKLAFEEQFKTVINYYSKHGGISFFYNELRIKNISPEICDDFFALAKKMKETITSMPMKYIGRSLTDNYFSIFKYHSTGSFRNQNTQNTQWLINNCGYFTIPLDYFNAFKILGSFIAGTDNILFKWAEFSVNASKSNLSSEKVIQEILKIPITEREISDSKRLYKDVLKNNGEVICVWTETRITNYDIDHVMPFSIYKNNDLWNLLPSKRTINNNKRDKIPSSKIITKRKDIIIHYWEMIHKKHQDKFMDEIQISLLGNLIRENWQNAAFNQLLNTSKYLIETRGYQQWEV